MIDPVKPRLFYQPMTVAPTDRPVWLVFEDAVGQWRSLAPYYRRGDQWCSVTTNLPASQTGCRIVGWQSVEDDPPVAGGA